MPATHATRHTLLGRAFSVDDQGAWQQLVAHYRRFIFYVLREMGVPREEVDDIFQKVLIALSQSLPSYDRDKARFRTWLSSVIRNTAISHLKKEQGYQKRVGKLDDPSYLQQLGNPEEVDAMIEREWASYIADQAMAKVKQAFKGQAIDVFELSLDGLSTEAIAEKTGLAISTVYTLRKRVKKRLYLEILELTQDLEP